MGSEQERIEKQGLAVVRRGFMVVVALRGSRVGNGSDCNNEGDDDGGDGGGGSIAGGKKVWSKKM